MSSDPLRVFSDPVRAWFSSSFAEPTPPQEQGWPAISAGENTLILSPTGSGKTLAAFLWGLDRLMTQPVPERELRTRLLYISPLRALAVDVEKNLRSPLSGVMLAADRLGVAVHAPTVGMRTGDTPADERRRLVRNPPDLLITTPESLYLMLTSAARETLRNVDAVIVDEIHSVASTKRGAHLALTLERLERLTDRPLQRIGLSATQRPLEEIANFLGGRSSSPAAGRWRPVTVVDAGVSSPMDLEVVVPVEDMAELGRYVDDPDSEAGPVKTSIWPSVHPAILDQIEAHRSTIVFVNSRRLAERLAGRLNELWDERDEEATSVGPGARDERGEGASGAAGARSRSEATDPSPVEQRIAAHHGSLSKVKRLEIEVGGRAEQ